MAYYPLPQRNQMEKYIGEQIAELVEDLSISSKYVVYVLECGRDIPPEQRMTALEQFMNDSDEYSKPTQYRDIHTKKPEEERVLIEVAPDWWGRVCRADIIYYVGYTDNLGKRLSDHILGTEDGALFTKVFEPDALLSVREYDTQKLAMKREKQVAKTLNDFENYNLFYTDYQRLPIKKTQKQNKWSRFYGTELRESSKNPESVEERKQGIVNRFEESDLNCLTEFVLDEQIRTLESHFDSPSYDEDEDQIYYRAIWRHLKNCREMLEQRESEDIEPQYDIDEAIIQVRDFYRGAYLDYRGLIRRMKSEKLVYAYQN
jgi:predicted GIY-YIG superfamily endonuclease